MFLITKINDEYSVSSQLRPEFVEQVASAGFRSIIALRPDEEVDPDITVDVIAAKASQFNIKTYYVPVYSDPEKRTAIEAIPDFKKALEFAETPALAYCRSGMRGAKLLFLNFFRSG